MANLSEQTKYFNSVVVPAAVNKIITAGKVNRFWNDELLRDYLEHPEKYKLTPEQEKANAEYEADVRRDNNITGSLSW